MQFPINVYKTRPSVLLLVAWCKSLPSPTVHKNSTHLVSFGRPTNRVSFRDQGRDRTRPQDELFESSRASESVRDQGNESTRVRIDRTNGVVESSRSSGIRNEVTTTNLRSARSAFAKRETTRYDHSTQHSMLTLCYYHLTVSSIVFIVFLVGFFSVACGTLHPFPTHSTQSPLVTLRFHFHFHLARYSSSSVSGGLWMTDCQQRQRSRS